MSQCSGDEIVSNLAPCGLNCGGCLAYRGSPIRKAAAELQRLLGPNFPSYAARFSKMNSVFENYPAFSDLLSFIADGTCEGCRGTGCLFTTCRVGYCVKEKGVDFCFECPEFPCEDNQMPPALEERWRTNNERMREQGVESYYLYVKDKPRYP